MLDDDTERKKCLEVVEEARERTDKTVFCNFEPHLTNKLLTIKLIYQCEEKRKKLRREAIAAAALEAENQKSKSKSQHHKKEVKPVSKTIEEDDPDKVRYSSFFAKYIHAMLISTSFALVSLCNLRDDM